jgi:glycosyltransferase involved in cell wall biosynthesis
MKYFNVIHVITTIERGGAELQLLTLAQEQIKLGYKVRVLFLKGSPDLKIKFQTAGVSVDGSQISRNPLKAILQIRRNITSDTNLVHAHLPRAEILTRLALLRKNVPFVVSRHNAEPFVPLMPGLVSRTISRFVISRTNLVVAISATVKEFLSINGEVLTNSKIRIVHYGYSRQESSHVLPRKSVKDTNVLQFIAVGRLVHQKNYPFMFASLAMAAEKGLHFRLSILGSGKLSQPLKQILKDSHLETRIEWLGKQENVIDFMKHSDALLITSHYEGFGLVLLEAMQAALPIIAPRHSTFPEILGASYPGLFEPNDEISMAQNLLLLKKPSYFEEASSKSLLRLEDFSPNRMANSMNQCYKEASSRNY